MREVQKIESGDVTLGKLLTEQNYLFRVSNYQRHYVWTEKEVRRFLTDGEFCWIQAAEGERFIHFAGQISLRTIETGRNMLTKVEIVDGQQRLTTFLLLTAVAARMMKLEFGHADAAEALWKKYFVAQAEFSEDEERLMLSRRDQEFWRQLTRMEEREIPDAVTESQKQLRMAEQEIGRYLREELAGKRPDEDPSGIMQDYIEAVASSFRFVLLKTSSPGYAYALYQTVNDRGVPLTSGELLKARTIELLSDRKNMAQEAEQVWDDILEDPGTVTDRYLTWNYIAVTGRRMETKRSATIHEQYERDIFCCYNRRILSEVEQQTVKRQLDMLKVNVERMRSLAGGILPGECSGYAGVLFDALVKMLKNTFCIPVYLKILDMKEKNRVRTINSITPMLVKAFFVAKTMGGLHDGVISNAYLEIWKYIDSDRADMEEIRRCLEKLMERDSCREEFGSKIKADVYARGASGNAKAKFLLLMLELYYLKQVEGGGNDCGDDSVTFRVSEMSVEHILRESVDPNEVSRAFYESIHKIGNLTLAGKRVNTRMKNSDFEAKRERYQRSPYHITREVGRLEHWTKKTFDERQEQLTEDLKKAFEL